MFKVGEKVFYPNHGGAVIEQIEEREIQEKTREYYVLKFVLGNVSIMVPVDNCDASGMRKLCSEEDLELAIQKLKDESLEVDRNWSRRYRVNEQKIKTGELSAIIDVVRDLYRADAIKKLSPGENKIFENACNILLSEIMLVKDIDVEEARKVINDLIF